MRTYVIDKERISYVDSIDTLYVGYGENALDACDDIIDVGSGLTVMFTGGEFSGAEIFDFKKTYGPSATQVIVPLKDPFVIQLPA